MWHEEFDEVLCYGDEPEGWIDQTEPGDVGKTGLCKPCSSSLFTGKAS
jgi:hypothetical protein